MSYSLPAAVRTQVDDEVRRWTAENTVERIWNKDASVWTGGDEGKWLGWLSIVDEELTDTEKYEDLYRDITKAGFTDVLLMGMGGSSLCPEVLAHTFGKTNFRILDSTVPSQVKAIENEQELTSTLFIVASKSGSTLEPNCFKQYFFERVSEIVGPQEAGRQFIAITDPGSKMEEIARSDGFRHIFYGKPEVGGRFSALSAFGMTAAAAMGVDTVSFLSKSREMVDACRDKDPSENPGALLGLILGACHKAGCDKLTIFTSGEVSGLGAWMEQLIAESTGKDGVAIIPVDREPEIEISRYSNDRVFVLVGVGEREDHADIFTRLTDAGRPVVRMILDDVDSLGQEFFRWEFATAVAGSVMKIDPFNQPDVEAAKIEARKITDEYERQGELPQEDPVFSDEGMSLFTSVEQANVLTRSTADISLGDVLSAHIGRFSEGDYFALLAYVEMNDIHDELLTKIRSAILDRIEGGATCLGFGPRFLHSTGQAYKGGPNTGLFLQITSEDRVDMTVPGQRYTFGVVKAAQARGDFQVLLDRGRRALRIHLQGDTAAGLKRILAAIETSTAV